MTISIFLSYADHPPAILLVGLPPAICGRKEQLSYEAIASKSEGTCNSYFYVTTLDKLVGGKMDLIFRSQ